MMETKWVLPNTQQIKLKRKFKMEIVCRISDKPQFFLYNYIL